MEKPNVRKQYIMDLTIAVNQFQTDGFEIILSLDANETNGQATADGIVSLIESCTLHDLHCLRRTLRRQPTNMERIAGSTICSARKG